MEAHIKNKPIDLMGLGILLSQMYVIIRRISSQFTTNESSDLFLELHNKGHLN